MTITFYQEILLNNDEMKSMIKKDFATFPMEWASLLTFFHFEVREMAVYEQILWLKWMIFYDKAFTFTKYIVIEQNVKWIELLIIKEL